MEIISREEAIERGLTHFFTGKPCIHGHIAKRYVSSKQCFVCNDDRMEKHRERNWKHTASKEQLSVDKKSKSDAKANGHRQYKSVIPCPNGHLGFRHISGGCVECTRINGMKRHAENREKANADRKARRNANLELARAKDREYRKANREKVSKSHVATRRKRRAKDPLFAIKHRVRGLVSRSISDKGFKKGSKTEAILGCSWEELIDHIERQFLKGMTWENRHLWHIDHIIPLSTATTEEDVISLNHVSNLRPMWGGENISKSDKVLFLI